MTPSSSPPPGWYADPWRTTAFRWWDGYRWTEWASGPPPRHRLDSPSPTFRPWGAVVVAVATVATIFAAREIGGTLGYRRAGFATLVFYLLLFGGMASACVVASRVFGTGSLVRDFGWRFRVIDIGWGIAALVASFIARVAFAAIVGIDRSGTNNLRDGLHRHNDVLVVFLFAALIGAPLFEELVFRGVIQRSLTRVVGREAAIIGQGLLFGFYHVVGAFDLTTVYYVGSLSVIGMVFGIVADRTGRLGPGMVAHFLSNALAMAVLLA